MTASGKYQWTFSARFMKNTLGWRPSRLEVQWDHEVVSGDVFDEHFVTNSLGWARGID